MKRAFVASVAGPGDEEGHACADEEGRRSAEERDSVGAEAEASYDGGVEVVEAVCCVVADEHEDLASVSRIH